jgi:hypothetical protein
MKTTHAAGCICAYCEAKNLGVPTDPEYEARLKFAKNPGVPAGGEPERFVYRPLTANDAPPGGRISAYDPRITVSGDTVTFRPFVAAEAVDHPAHYGGADDPYEAIKVIEAWQLGFCLGNTVKYLSRAGKKGSRIEDLRKAAWYLQREIDTLTGEGGAA